ncbi:vWA domain-containing protein [Candidatus Methanocrinis natronophilus]|nr:VWA domain-containing protein [Candidatus Methanocrinis natronophilus]
MNTIWKIICIAAFIILCPNLCLGMNQSQSDDRTWYRFEAPDVSAGLVDEGPGTAAGEENSLWIVDLDAEETRTSLEIPMGFWARLMLLPSDSGHLEMFCRYPTGTVDLLIEDDVEAGSFYTAWYQAEWSGTYEIWYRLDGAESNQVMFKVGQESFGYRGIGSGPSAPGSMAPSSSSRGYGGPYVMSAPAPEASVSIGFAAGGAKDIENFRQNIEQGYLPLPTDVTYEGLFYDYYFETGEVDECEKLFCPSYSCAISKDPLSGEVQRYLSVGLNSGITDFQRKKLNLVVVLDYSGSMGSPFSKYYYDQFGNWVEIEDNLEDSGKTKMEIANQAVVDLLGRLNGDDRFGLVVFSNNAYVVEPLTDVEDKDLEKLGKVILDIRDYGGTNMEAGMTKGTSAYRKYIDIDPSEQENRIIFLTDAMPNLGGTRENDLHSILEKNAGHGIYTTFIGIGLDFNTELIEKISKIKGANYYSVHSASKFKDRMDNEFDFMVTPLVFNLTLELDAPGYQIEKVYGSPEADEATGEIMKVNTLFPSRAEEGEVRGGIILIKLKEISSEGEIKLGVSYEDRNGTIDGDEAQVVFPDDDPDFYENNGIRKAVLLSRYADLLKSWIADERRAMDTGQEVVHSVTMEEGIIVPQHIILGKWERQSLPLHVSDHYISIFSTFASYFGTESVAIEDIDLQQEMVILDKLRGFEGDEVREVDETSPSLSDSDNPVVDAPKEGGYQTQEPTAKALEEINPAEEIPLSMSVAAISTILAAILMRFRRR